MNSSALTALLLFTASGLAAQPSCRTSIGIPCYTIRATHTQWQALAQDPLKISKVTETNVRAVRRDGSFVAFGEMKEELLFGGLLGAKQGAQLYLAPENAIVKVNRTEHTISRREPLIWHDLPYRRSADGDSTCQTGIRHFGSDFQLNGNSTVAGVPVVKWSRADGSEDHYLAPSLDCIELKREKIKRNRLWIPIFTSRWEATSVELGEPKPELFVLPTDYKQVEDPERARLLQFLRATGGPRLPAR